MPAICISPVFPLAFVNAGLFYPESLPNCALLIDPARGLVLSGADVVTAADQATGGVADVATGLVGAEPQYVANSSGYPAFSFSGSPNLDKFTIPDSADIAATAAVTYSVWTLSVTSGVLQGIWGQYDAPYRTALYLNSGDFMFFEMNNVSTAKFAYPTDSNWHHVAFVFDGSLGTPADRIVGYLDGAPIALTKTGTNPAALNVTALPAWIGMIQTAPVNSWNGELGTFAIYNRALTPSDIVTIYNGYQTR